MTMMVIFSIIYLYFIFNDLVPIYEKKNWTLFWSYTSFTILSYFLFLLLAFEVNIPSPSIPIKNLVNTIF